jgi:hypothetical protein
MKRFALLLLIAGLASGAELTGKWSGTFVEVGPDAAGKDPGQAFMDLKLTGKTVTGTAGPTEQHQLTIVNGTLEGKKLTFDVVQAEAGFTMKFDLTFDGENIHGTASAEQEGKKLSAKIDLKRKP